jgi:hypothetical protein
MYRSQFVDRRRFRSAHDVERDRLMRVAAKALHFEIEVTGVERIAERRGRLRGSLEAKHAFIPRFAGEPIASLRASAARSADARTEPP